MRRALHFVAAAVTRRQRLIWQEDGHRLMPLTPVAVRCICSLALVSTHVFRKDVRRGDRGESRRLTFDERAERRMGKSREEKVARENLLQEADTVINEDVPAELEEVFAQHFERANVAAMKVLNLAKCVELLEVDVGGGRKVLLSNLAHVIKTGNLTLEIVAHNSSFSSAILQRVARFDGTLQVSKELQKIKVVMPPITTGRREKAADEIRQVVSSLKQKTKQVRARASRALHDAGMDESAVRELHARLDETVNTFTDEKVVELEQLIADVTSMGLEESDVGV